MGVLSEMGRRLRGIDERVFSEEFLTTVPTPRRPRWVFAWVIAASIWLMVSIVLMLTLDKTWGISVALASLVVTGITMGMLIRDKRESGSR